MSAEETQSIQTPDCQPARCVSVHVCACVGGGGWEGGGGGGVGRVGGGGGGSFHFNLWLN